MIKSVMSDPLSMHFNNDSKVYCVIARDQRSYTWNTDHLSRLGPNGNTSRFGDVLNASGLTSEMGLLKFGNVGITTNPYLSPADLLFADRAINRRKRNPAEHRLMRGEHFTHSPRRKNEDPLNELAPFVQYEADRQHLL